jgi:hypothetical protein
MARIITLISIISIIFSIISHMSSEDLVYVISVITGGIIIYYMFTNKVKLFLVRLKSQLLKVFKTIYNKFLIIKFKYYLVEPYYMEDSTPNKLTY